MGQWSDFIFKQLLNCLPIHVYCRNLKIKCCGFPWQKYNFPWPLSTPLYSGLFTEYWPVNRLTICTAICTFINNIAYYTSLPQLFWFTIFTKMSPNTSSNFCGFTFTQIYRAYNICSILYELYKIPWLLSINILHAFNIIRWQNCRTIPTSVNYQLFMMSLIFDRFHDLFPEIFCKTYYKMTKLQDYYMTFFNH